MLAVLAHRRHGTEPLKLLVFLEIIIIVTIIII